MTPNKRQQTGVGRDLVQLDPVSVCVVPVKHNTGLFTEGEKLDLLRNSTHGDNNRTLFHCVHTHTNTQTSAACYHHLTQQEIHCFKFMLTQYHVIHPDNWTIGFYKSNVY